MPVFAPRLRRTRSRAATRLRSTATSLADPKPARGHHVADHEHPLEPLDGPGIDAAARDVLIELAFLRRLIDEVPNLARRCATADRGDDR
jgi:hypothetical protein